MRNRIAHGFGHESFVDAFKADRSKFPRGTYVDVGEGIIGVYQLDRWGWLHMAWEALPAERAIQDKRWVAYKC